MKSALALITFVDRSGRPVDPGFGQGGGGPVDPGFGVGGGGPVDPGFGVGGGPVDPGFGVGLPPVIDNGLPGHGHIDNGLPTYPVRPDNSLPSAPGIWPKPPFVGVWPPRQPIYPSLPIYPTDGIDNSLPLPPGSVWPPLPPTVSGKILAFCWLVGIGYRWVVLDPSVDPGFGNPGGERPSHELPATPQPKR